MERCRSAVVALIAGIMLGIVGCSQTFPWAGKWVGNRNLPVKEGQNPSVAYTIGKIELTIQTDGKFILVEGGVPKTGTAVFHSDSATLTVLTFMDRPISRMGSGAESMNQPITLKVKKEGGIELIDPSGFDKAPIVLQRSSP